MITKLTHISSVGPFHDFHWSTDLFSKNTIIFGVNGNGKSTLTRIFRSASTKEPKYILEKKTFGSTIPQSVEMCIHTDGTDKEIKFSGGAWIGPNQAFSVFDSHFISENIFDGERLMDVNRVNLHKVIVGDVGRQLAIKIGRASKTLRELRDTLQVNDGIYQREPFAKVVPINVFLIIPPNPNVESEILTLKNRIDFTTLTNEPILPTLSSGLPTNFRTELDKDLESVHDQAKTIIQAHIEKHWNDPSHRREFLAEGIVLVDKPNCPFCGQNLTPVSELLDAYKMFFDQKYQAWELGIRSSTQLFQRWNLESEIKTLYVKISEWDKYLPSECKIALDWLNENVNRLQESKKAFDLECEEKQKNLQYKLDFAQFDRLKVLVQSANDQIASLNTSINEYKQKSKTQDPVVLSGQLLQLKAVEARQQKKWINFCSDYQALRTKIDLEKKTREVIIKQLQEYSISIFDSYQVGINEILEDFSADFRIDDLSEKTDLRKSTSVYCGFNLVFFSQHHVSIENSDEIGPTIHNTLSQGDKSLLAFAFFVATLRNDTELASKIVVIDDPISSFDSERKLAMVNSLATLKNTEGKRPDQLIVLTHEKGFLADIFNNRFSFGTEHASYFNIVSDGYSQQSCKISKIQHVHPEEDLLKSREIRLYEQISRWATVNETIPDSAYADCRILLETIMKQKYWPDLCNLPPGGGLREFLNKLKELKIYLEPQSAPFEGLMPYLREIHHSLTELDQSRSDGDIKYILRQTLKLAKKV